MRHSNLVILICISDRMKTIDIIHKVTKPRSNSISYIAILEHCQPQVGIYTTKIIESEVGPLAT